MTTVQDGRSARTDEELVRLIRTSDVTTSSAAVRELTDRYRPLVHGQANRHLARNQADRQDLVSEADVGLQKAIADYDLDPGVPFAAYAKARVVGQLRNWYRDQRYGPHVPRTHHELHMRVRSAQMDLGQSGTEPTIENIAVHLEVEPDRIVEALAAGSAERYRTAQLEAAIVTTTTEVDHAELRLLIESLPDRQRRLLHARFWEDRTQLQVAGELGVSQAQASRLQAQAIDHLRTAYARSETG